MDSRPGDRTDRGCSDAKESVTVAAELRGFYSRKMRIQHMIILELESTDSDGPDKVANGKALANLDNPLVIADNASFLFKPMLV